MAREIQRKRLRKANSTFFPMGAQVTVTQQGRWFGLTGTVEFVNQGSKYPFEVWFTDPAKAGTKSFNFKAEELKWTEGA